MKTRTERRSATPVPVDRLHSPLGVDIGVLVLRLTVGLLLAGHGSQKLFGLFGGSGLAGTGKWFAYQGYRPGEFFAGLAGASEVIGGLGLAVGLFTPLAAAAVVGVMINAMVTTAPHGLWDVDGGLELPLCMAVVALAVTAIGPGRFAVDRIFPWRVGGLRAAAFALVLGGIGAAIVLAV
ncbi:DoxX family protein [Peterkaempfera griseoplana]|uniref:DoxX family protein n=1 Tax=Peterkaempfera griseoplana TaxID=66896 RepID=UPI0006E42689|nr:DoxX family protein [Peterkaempfera griseoplana]